MRKSLALTILLVVFLLVSFTAASAKSQEFDFSVDWGYWYGGGWGKWSSSWEATSTPDTQVLFRNILKYRGMTGGVTHTFSEIPLSRNLTGPPNFYEVRAVRLYEPGGGSQFLSSDWNSFFCLPGPKFEVLLSPESKVVVENTTVGILYVRVQKNDKWKNKWEALQPGESMSIVGNNLLVQANTQPIDAYEYQCGWIEWNNPFK